MKNVFGILRTNCRTHASRATATVAASLCDASTRPIGPRLQLMLRNAHFFPTAALFFPVVKRFAVDLVDGSLRSLHIDARKIFAAAKAGKPIIVDPYQIER